MKKNDQYILNIKGLGFNPVVSEYVLYSDFLTSFEGSEILGGTARAEVVARKQGSDFVLDIDIRGEVVVCCDRCLGEFPVPVEYSGRLFVKTSEKPEETDGEILWIYPSETEVDLGQYLYETVSLSVPFRKVHPGEGTPAGACDSEMLSRFRIVTEEEFERMFPEETEGTNPEWQKQLTAAKEKLQEKEKNNAK